VVAFEQLLTNSGGMFLVIRIDFIELTYCVLVFVYTIEFGQDLGLTRT